MKKLACIVIGLALAGQSIAATDMAEAWQVLRDQNSTLRSQQSTLSAKAASINEARARRLPEVSLSGRWNQLDEEIGVTLDASSIMPGLDPIYYKIQDEQFLDVELTATLPIYTGGAITAGIEAAQANQSLAKAQADQVKSNLFATFVERYLTVQLAVQKDAIQHQTFTNLEQHLSRANRMYEEGTMSLTEKLQTQVERDSALRNWQQAEQDVQLANSAYESLFPDEVELPAGQLTFKKIKALEESEINTIVKERSPALAQIAAADSLIAAGDKANNAEYLPKVALFAQWELNPDDLTVTEPEWAAGIALEWKLLSGGWFAKRQALTDQGEALYWQQTQIESDLELLVRMHLTSAEHAHTDYKALQSSLDLANENLRLQSKAFEQGLRTSLDKIDAQLLVTGLELKSQKALFDYYLALANLSALMKTENEFLQLMQTVSTQ